MKAPSYQEILSVQSQIEHDLMVEEFPEWYAQPFEERVTRDGVTMQQFQADTHFRPFEIVILIALVIGITACMIAIINL